MHQSQEMVPRDSRNVAIYISSDYIVIQTKIHFARFRRRKNALIGVKIEWNNQRLYGSWNAYLASPGYFAWVDDIITNLAKERDPGIEIIEPHSSIFDYF